MAHGKGSPNVSFNSPGGDSCDEDPTAREALDTITRRHNDMRFANAYRASVPDPNRPYATDEPLSWRQVKLAEGFWCDSPPKW